MRYVLIAAAALALSVTTFAGQASVAVGQNVVTALQAAWASIVQTPGDLAHPASHLEAALRTAVGIGNDTDTVAAIAGGLLGATHGASAVPPSWRQVLHGWPGYRAADLARLALMAAGRSVAPGDLPEDLLSNGPA